MAPPSAAQASALPVAFQPDRSLPLNRGVNPAGGWADAVPAAATRATSRWRMEGAPGEGRPARSNGGAWSRIATTPDEDAGHAAGDDEVEAPPGDRDRGRPA